MLKSKKNSIFQKCTPNVFRKENNHGVKRSSGVTGCRVMGVSVMGGTVMGRRVRGGRGRGCRLSGCSN